MTTFFHVDDYFPAGTDIDTETDHSAALNAALAAAEAAGGGTVHLGARRYTYDPPAGSTAPNDLIIPVGVTLEGRVSPGGIVEGGDYTKLRFTLVIPASRTIRIRHTSALHGVCIMRKGLRIPTTHREAVDEIAAFAGRAVSVGDGTGVGIGLGNDSTISSLVIIGFEWGIYINRASRVRIRDIMGDCTNGLYMGRGYDNNWTQDVKWHPMINVHSYGWGDVATGSDGMPGYRSSTSTWTENGVQKELTWYLLDADGRMIPTNDRGADFAQPPSSWSVTNGEGLQHLLVPAEENGEQVAYLIITGTAPASPTPTTLQLTKPGQDIIVGNSQWARHFTRSITAQLAGGTMAGLAMRWDTPVYDLFTGALRFNNTTAIVPTAEGVTSTRHELVAPGNPAPTTPARVPHAMLMFTPTANATINVTLRLSKAQVDLWHNMDPSQKRQGDYLMDADAIAPISKTYSTLRGWDAATGTARVDVLADYVAGHTMMGPKLTLGTYEGLTLYRVTLPRPHQMKDDEVLWIDDCTRNVGAYGRWQVRIDPADPKYAVFLYRLARPLSEFYPGAPRDEQGNVLTADQPYQREWLPPTNVTTPIALGGGGTQQFWDSVNAVKPLSMRAGVGYHIYDCDGMTFNNCTEFGHDIAYNIGHNAHATKFTNIGCDAIIAAGDIGTLAFNMWGNVIATRVIGGWTSSRGALARIASTNTSSQTFMGGNYTGGARAQALVYEGAVNFIGCNFTGGNGYSPFGGTDIWLGEKALSCIVVGCNDEKTVYTAETPAGMAKFTRAGNASERASASLRATPGTSASPVPFALLPEHNGKLVVLPGGISSITADYALLGANFRVELANQGTVALPVTAVGFTATSNVNGHIKVAAKGLVTLNTFLNGTTTKVLQLRGDTAA